MRLLYTWFLILALSTILYAESYPDQHHLTCAGDQFLVAEEISGICLDKSGNSFCLEEGVSSGYIILHPDSSVYPFNRGLPSWNGNAPDYDSGFLVQIRFHDGNSWSPWLTAGYWKDYIWNSYGQTSYAGGYIDYDYVKLNIYLQRWQFKILMRRKSVSNESPLIKSLSLFISDTRTTDNTDYSLLFNDKPAEIFIATQFIYQYAVDDVIGPSICSPTSVSMELKSYDIAVDPLEFARGTRDPYFGIFGMWPRVVQHASEYGLKGSVTRYRSWSQTREILAAGGRIVMSIGPPLYSGHLIMLAGFTTNGDPIVHDPARSNGYSYVYNKNDLAHSWFEKGGIAYTFFPADSQMSAIPARHMASAPPDQFDLDQNYPNPFNNSTNIAYTVFQSGEIKILLFDIKGSLLKTLFSGNSVPGSYVFQWNADDLSSGTYYIRLISDSRQKTIKSVLLK